MVLYCHGDRHGGGYLSLRIALGVVSGREIGALTEASGTFEDGAVERNVWLGSCQSRKSR